MQRIVVFVSVLSAIVAAGAVHWWRTYDIGAAQRGARLAADRGCLNCHSAAGAAADPDGTRGIGSVPGFDHEAVSEHARDEAEIREWILDGRPRRLAVEASDPLPPVLQMPAWRGRLSEGEVDDLVAYVEAVSDFDPAPAAAARGRDTAARLGCFACHGLQGRADPPNPGSLKGHIPSWAGRDFAELARDDGEVREWIRDGAPRRLRENPVAAFFLDRQAIRMPAFGDRVSEEEVQHILAYIRWLRGEAGGASAPPR